MRSNKNGNKLRVRHNDEGKKAERRKLDSRAISMGKLLLIARRLDGKITISTVQIGFFHVPRPEVVAERSINHSRLTRG
jgi:hypothetical protein